jgi:acetyl esterase/lipase
MKFSNNRDVLASVVKERAAIRNVSKHRNPDGSMDVDGNLKLWNSVMDRFEWIPLWEDGAPNYDDRAPLQPEPNIIFIPAPDNKTPRGCIIVAHGGGFLTRTGCEGFNVADFFNKEGFAVTILTYRLIPYSRFDALADMQRAIRLLRSRKDELGITDKIAVMGFSAGGMLSGNAATNYDSGNPESDDPVERFSCRPDAAVLAYGAFTSMTFPTGFGMMLKGPGSELTQEERYKLAVEKRITPDTPPFFIWQTMSDDGRHGMATAKALQDVGVPYELHIFTSGVHGCALADGENDLDLADRHVAHWGKLCAEWLESMGL